MVGATVVTKSIVSVLLLLIVSTVFLGSMEQVMVALRNVLVTVPLARIHWIVMNVLPVNMAELVAPIV